jgi:NADH-quinone oxidoreductase subunit M
LLLLPIAGVITLLFLRHPAACRWVALGVSLGTFLFSLSLLIPFDWHRGTIYGYRSEGGSMQLVHGVMLIRSINLHFKLGVDGLSLPLMFLTAFLMPVVITASWKIEKRVRSYLALLLILEANLLAAFLSIDLLQFYFFTEMSLIPIFILIGIWGGPRRRRAVVKFILCKVAGSIALLIGIIGLYLHSRRIVPSGSFDLILLANPKFAYPLAGINGLFLLVMAGFLVPLPTLLFHSWLPDAHTEAPAPISMALAGVVQSLGGYGILRLAYPLFPQAARSLWLVFALLGVLTLIYGSLCAMAQTDFKRLIAFSSLSQMGLILLGISTMTPAGINGAMFMIIANGLIGALLFFIVGIIHDRVKHHDINRLGGLAAAMPIYTSFSIVAFLASLGLPGLCGFVGQVLVILGTFQAARPDGVLYQHALATGGLSRYLVWLRIIAIAACASTILTAGSTLWALQRIYYGPKRPDPESLADINLLELVVLLPLTIVIVLLGIMPGILVFTLSNPTIAALLRLFWR